MRASSTTDIMAADELLRAAHRVKLAAYRVDAAAGDPFARYLALGLEAVLDEDDDEEEVDAR